MNEQKIITLNNGILEAEIRLPGACPESERFDSAAVIQQVTLHGRHRFGQPEQHIPTRVTCHGFGLCAEFVMDDIGREAGAGELFPKPGIGVLTQIADGKPYDMWSHYEIQRYPKTWEMEKDGIIFREEPLPCMGIALEIVRRLRLLNNQIILETEIHNTGTRRAAFSEYQHNFVAIDDLPVGEGYQLEIPFDGTLIQLPECCRNLPDFKPVEGFICVEKQKAAWVGKVVNQTWHKTTEADNILCLEKYGWKLTHRDSDASVSEDCDFKPSKLVLWGVEHCICTEVYHAIDIMPGEKDRYIRTWTFEDEETGKDR